jgi:hypothetical protein
MGTASSAVEAAAREYLARGWSVIPLRPGDKRPTLKWQAFQYRRAASEDLADWYGRWPQAGVAVVTGAVSGLVVVDVDPKHGGEASLAELERSHGPLPATVTARTGGGGRHLYFLHPGGLVRNQVGLAPGIDLRGDGGYVVAPPSLHPRGGIYAWEAGLAPGEVALAVLPPWLVAASAARHGHGLEHWRRLVREGVAQGARNDTLASLSGHLLWHGVDAEVVLELMLAWNAARCRPPLAAEEVARTVWSITRLHERSDEPAP